MSRRKQSNPKPLKREDEEWTSDAEVMQDSEISPNSKSPTDVEATVQTTSETENVKTPPPQASSDSASGGEETSTTPRLRLNTSLATDPALRPQATSIVQTPISESPEASTMSPVSHPTPTSTSEYLNSLPPAFQTALAAGRYFALPHLNIVDPTAATTAAAVATTRPPSEPLESPITPSRIGPIYTCLPCGIKFSSLSTLEAHRTYYCSHRKTSSDADDAKSVTSGTDSGNVAVSNDDSSVENPTKAPRTGKQYACTHCSYSADKKVSLNRHMRMHAVSPSLPAPLNSTSGTTNGDVVVDIPSPASQIQDRYCADCDIRFSSLKTFRAHKLHYCSTRHIVKPSTNLPPAAPASVQSKTASSCTSGSAPPSPTEGTNCKTPPSPIRHVSNSQYLAFPTNPVLIVPYSLFQSASLLPGPTIPGLPSTDAPCFLLPNGTFQPVSQAIPSSFTSVTVSSRNATTPEVLKAANKPRDALIPKDPSIPLDLSVRRTPDFKELVIELGDEHEKENRHHRTPTPEHIVCAPSLPGSPPLTPSPRQRASPSSSPKRKHHESRSNSPRMTRSTPKSNNSDVESIQHSPDNSKTPTIPSIAASAASLALANIPLLLRAPIITPELAMRLAAELPVAALQPSPQVLVKQGVSKCKECNIVFCKYENYIAHKKHYCSARLLDDEGSTSKNSGSPPVSPPQNTGKASPTGQYQQLICVACGIKFTSLDNLNAHQAYYCLKRNELQTKITEADIRRCVKCKAIAEPNHQCVIAIPQSGGWKCPCCDVVSTTASAAQRHMETHSGVKAYRCTICGYKGNTLRGMRTHIRVHFEKRTADLQEEKFITCILEEEIPRVSNETVSQPPPPLVPVLPEPENASPNSEPIRSNEQRHFCDLCNYSSSFRNNVIRHSKLVHANAGKILSGSTVTEPEEIVINGSRSSNITPVVKSMPVLDTEEVIIKQETSDVEIEVDVTAPDDEAIKKEDIKIEIKSDISNESPDSELVQEALKSGPKYCKSCDITFTYYSTFIAHKKFYCSSHTGEIAASAGNNNNTTNNRAAEASVL